VQTVTYNVKLLVLKHAAGANPNYAAAEAAARVVVDAPYRVSVKGAR
jgi:hypothetical protein